ncbi:MAG: ABC transporter ATP-binding protein [Treponema sp.]|nr:ABC transporter ATP-binding protein [Treponema sp.]
MSEVVINIENVSKTFSDGTVALKNVSLEINKNDFVVLAGSNGSGKTVLMGLIAKINKPTSGSIDAKNVGVIFQDSDTQILGETPLEDVLFTLKNSEQTKKVSKEEMTNIAENILVDFALIEKKYSPSRLLSGGEKRRLCIATTLAMNTDILIFDEPFANLDYDGVKQVCTILENLKERGKTIIILTHEIEKILALANRGIVLHKGEICFDGNTEDFLKQNLEKWGIKNPLSSVAKKIQDLLWK